MSYKIVMVSLPESSEGRGIRGRLLVDTNDVDVAAKALEGRGLGVMGTELREGDFSIVDILTVEDLKAYKDG